MPHKVNKLLLCINKLEDGLLILILSSMIVLAGLQIIGRNLFGEGIVWIDPLLRILVLWVGLAGAVVATRNDNQLKIDVFSKYLPARLQLWVQRGIYLFTAIICLLISWHGGRFVYSEFVYESVAFASVPVWLTSSIIPLSFLLIAFRYGLLLFAPPKQPAEML